MEFVGRIPKENNRHKELWSKEVILMKSYKRELSIYHKHGTDLSHYGHYICIGGMPG